MNHTIKDNISWRPVKVSNEKDIEFWEGMVYRSEEVAERECAAKLKEEYAIIPVYALGPTDVWARTVRPYVETSRGELWRTPDNERVSAENMERLQKSIREYKRAIPIMERLRGLVSSYE